MHLCIVFKACNWAYIGTGGEYAVMKAMKKRITESCICDEQGFTLVELIVVLVIIALLAGTIGPALIGYIDKTKENKTLNNAKKVYMAAQSYSEEAHDAFVKPSDKVTVSRISEFTQISFPEGTVPYSITYIDDTFNTANPTSDMYTIDTFTYTEDGYKATYQRTSGTWTVSKITS